MTDRFAFVIARHSFAAALLFAAITPRSFADAPPIDPAKTANTAPAPAVPDAGAQNPDAPVASRPPLTFEECARRVFANPENSEPWRLNKDKASHSVDLANANTKPIFSSVTKYTTASSSNVSTSSGPDGVYLANDRGVVGVNMAYPLYDGNRSRLMVRDARKRQDITNAEVEGQQLSLLEETGSAYYDLLYAQQAAVSGDLNLQASNALLKTSSERYRLGLVTKKDVLVAQSQVDDAVALNAARKQALNTALANLAFLVGEDPQTFSVAAVEPSPSPAPTHSPEESIAAATANSPSVKNLQANVDEKKITIDISKTQRKPTIGLQLSGGEANTQQSSGHYRWQSYGVLDVTLSYPLWDSNRLKYQIATEQDDLDLAKRNLETENSVIRREVLLQTQNVNALQAVVDSLTQHAASVSEALRLAQERYGLGLETQAGVLSSIYQSANTQDQLAKARQDRDIAVQKLLWTLGEDRGAMPASATIGAAKK